MRTGAAPVFRSCKKSSVFVQPCSTVIRSQRPSLERFASFSKDQWVFRRIRAERVIKNMAVIDFLPFGNVTLFRISRVIEPRIVEFPCDACGARALDGVSEQLPGRGLDDMQCAHL